MSRENERRYYDALKLITLYQSAGWLLKNGGKEYGLSGEVALEMAYENLQEHARAAIKGRRRPQSETPQAESQKG